MKQIDASRKEVAKSIAEACLSHSFIETMRMALPEAYAQGK